jgi:hypothetical protein
MCTGTYFDFMTKIRKIQIRVQRLSVAISLKISVSDTGCSSRNPNPDFSSLRFIRPFKNCCFLLTQRNILLTFVNLSGKLCCCDLGRFILDNFAKMHIEVSFHH